MKFSPYFTVCLGWCCPCILGWMIAKRLGENPLFYCLGMYVMPVLPLMRQKTREKFGISVSFIKLEIYRPPKTEKVDELDGNLRNLRNYTYEIDKSTKST